MTPSECVQHLNEAVEIATFLIAALTAGGILGMVNLSLASKANKKGK